MERQHKHGLNSLIAVVCCSTVGLALPAVAQTVGVIPRAERTVGTPGRIGVNIRDVTAADVSREKLPAESGAYLTGVFTGGPADKAGLRAGDVIVEFDGERVRSAAELQRLVTETPPGRPVKVAAIRDGRRVDVTLSPAVDSYFLGPQAPRFDFREGPFAPPSNRPPQLWNRWYYSFPPDRRAPLPTSPRLGIRVQELTPQLAEYFGTRDGVLVATVDDNSPASRAGLRAGDIITTVDGEKVTRPDDVAKAVDAHRLGDEIRLGVVRDHEPITISVTLGVKRSVENRP